MKTPLPFLRICLSMTLMLAFFLTTTTEATAQKKKEEKVVVRSKSKTGDNSKETIVVEVKDGKVFVDGEEVADVDTEGRSVWVSSGDDDSEGRTFVFKGEEDADGVFRFNGKEIEMDHMLSDMDANHMQSRMAPMMDRMTSEMGEARMQSRMGPMMNRVMSFSNDGNAFEVMADGFNMESNGEIMKMDMQSRELAMQIRHEDGDTSAMEAELDQLLADIFAKKQDINQKRMDKLRAELEKMEQNLTERNSSKSDIIAKRKKELLGQPDKNDW